MHLTAFTNDTVVVHLASTPAGMTSATDSMQPLVGRLTVKTPADIRIGAAVQQLRLWTEGNLAVRVRFTDGASERERGLEPWGRSLFFVRTDGGDLQPQAEILPAQPERTVFTDSLLHDERCAALRPGDEWRHVCTPKDQAVRRPNR